jgi:2-keto-3-deoxy-L-rhamnonate aldolase RhmA
LITKISKDVGMINLKQQLKKDNFTIGSWITTGHPAIAEIMSQAGFDWLTVDMEHSAITLHHAQNLIRVIELCGIVPLVRPEENNPTCIKRVMDAGAHGVIVPMVNSRVEAEAAVSAVKYPPFGTRGVGLARAQKYGFGFEAYKKWMENESVVIVQIEHIKAIESLEAILCTPGVDGSFVGPYDLSGSLGWPGEFDRPEVQQALQYYEDTCRKMQKPMGFHVVQPDPVMTMNYRRKGYSFLAVGVDTLYLGTKCRETLGGLK